MSAVDLRTSSTTVAQVRDLTERLAAPLSPEDQAIQSMPDVSPTKWHRAHTTWFFETFVLGPHLAGYEPYAPEFAYLFNSYYEAVGSRHPRAERGLISRPGAAEVGEYRRHVDAGLARLLDQGLTDDVAALVELGLHHEQQHQELLLMDIQHVLSVHPFGPAYLDDTHPGATGLLALRSAEVADAPSWIRHDGGIVTVGHDGVGFAYDNEGPAHRVLLEPFELADRLVTRGEWVDFMHDGGYHRPELWMSDGWATVRAEGWEAPLYWEDVDGEWTVFGARGRAAVDRSQPVTHVSWYEADAFARWRDARLPTEAEWESLAPTPGAGAHLDPSVLCPRAAAVSPDAQQWYGELWQWTESSYRPYPGFRPAAGAVGEYNGKFMVNQQVLRGSSFGTPAGHARRSYRNFFPPGARWMFSGLRLARDLS
jgi:ergothioneine biosynthesis protein EgtB